MKRLEIVSFVLESDHEKIKRPACRDGIILLAILYFSEWFERRSISSSYSEIVRARVVLKRTVGGD